MFFCEFYKIFKNIYWQNNSGWLLLVLIWEFWEVFQNTSFLDHLISCTSCRISATRYSKKLFHKCFSSILYNEVARCQPASLRKKLFHTSSFIYFVFILSECITITSSEEALKVCEHNFFQRKVVLLVIYLFNHSSFKSIIFMLNMTFDVPLSAVFIK